MSQDHSHTHIDLASTQKDRYLTQTYLFVILEIVTKTNIERHTNIKTIGRWSHGMNHLRTLHQIMNDDFLFCIMRQSKCNIQPNKFK